MGLRDKYKGSNMSKIQDARKDAEEKSYASSGDKKPEWTYHTLVDGKNVFRIFPSHSPDNDPPFQPERIAYLKCEVLDENGKAVRKNSIVQAALIAYRASNNY